MSLKLNLPYPLLVFDTETGGLNSDYEIEWNLIEQQSVDVGSMIQGRVRSLPPPILEIGAVLLSPTTLEELDRFHTLCGPEPGQSLEDFLKRCTKKALETNKLDTKLDEIKNAPPMSQALKEFFKFIPKSNFSNNKLRCLLCGQNVRYDIEMINGASKRLGIDFVLNGTPIELSNFSQLYFSLPDTPTVANYKLTTVAEALGIPTEKAHTAMWDVTMTAECLKRIFNRLCVS